MGMYFIISGLFYSTMLNCVYHSKKHVDSDETRIFSSLLGLNLIGLILELFSSIFGQSGNVSVLLSAIMTRFYILYLMGFLLLFTLYIYIICYKTSNDKKILYFDALKKVSYVIFYIAAVAMIFMPLKLHSGYADGMAVDFVYLCSAACMGIWLLSMFKNFRRIKKQKFLPIVLFIVLAGIMSIIQRSHPSFTVMTAIQTFVIFLMFFTIENPDVKMIEELNVAKDEALKASKAKTEFLSSMSHEIRTPLNAILGFSNGLLDDTTEPKVIEDAKYIIDASESLLELVNGILDISKIEANKMELVPAEYDTESTLDSLVALAKTRLKDKPIQLKVSFDEDIPKRLYGDVSRLKQIILNLLTNAIKYTERGFIEFKVDSITKGDKVRLIISVEDSGLGIKKEDIDKLFSKFTRLELNKNISIEGTGLGLAITKNLVEMMNGKIVVQSEYGVGSKFIVALDQEYVVCKDLQLENPPIILNKKVKSFDNKKILIVDDNKLNLKVAEKVLGPYNVITTLAESGVEAKEILKNDSFDLILLDDMMPNKSGVETLKELKEENPMFDIPVVALTANAIDGMKEKYLNEGFDEYLAKPIDKVELARILNKFLN